MSSNDTVPFPLFNADTIAEYPEIIAALVFASISLLSGLMGIAYFMYMVPYHVRSVSDWSVLVMILLALVIVGTLVAQYTTQYYLLMLSLSNAALGLGSLMMTFVILDFMSIFSGIIKLKRFKKHHLGYYKLGFAIVNFVLLFNTYLPILNSVLELSQDVKRSKIISFGEFY